MESYSEPFRAQSSLITYGENSFQQETLLSLVSPSLLSQKGTIQWLNTYGLTHYDDFKALITANGLDDFLIKLLREPEQPNKVIVLENLIFISVKVITTVGGKFKEEQIMFIFSTGFVWSLAGQSHIYFDEIIGRLEHKRGLSRFKKSDYLVYLLLESIIEVYHLAFADFILANTNNGTSTDWTIKLTDAKAITEIRPTPEFTAQVEQRKQAILGFKKTCLSLKELIQKMERLKENGIKTIYFSDLKEEVETVISEIDFSLQELESKINLIFSIQGHRLNEVMKTLTIFSVFFIPLTFIAGIYGMNFRYMPGLEMENGYYIVMAIMLIISTGILIFVKKRKWF
ncbi:MAG: magnesium and cobalt transport protein CorA [Flammeovirgaceae bacterium]|nr:magnesium and cobalt transport protein CorA [Flammeovirgaceae bacterium]